MILACPKCHAGFFVNPTQIGPDGRRVKCSKCQHVWLGTIPVLDPKQQLAVAERVQPIPEGSNLPAIIPLKIHPLLYAAPAIFSILIAASFWYLTPNVAERFGICGQMCIDEHLSLGNIDYEYDQLAGTITIDYRVINSAAYDIALPRVRISLLNDKNGIIASSFYDEALVIPPKQHSQNIRTVFKDVKNTNKVANVGIMLGTPLMMTLK